MEKKIKVLMLPTHNKANLMLGKNTGKLLIGVPNLHDNLFLGQHLYFTSDDEIKEGDWFISITGSVSKCCKNSLYFANHTLNEDQSICRNKIVATTDSLINGVIDAFGYNLPQPPQSFLTLFVKEHNEGNVIKEVIVEYYYDKIFGDGTLTSISTLNYKVNHKDNTITIKPDVQTRKESWNREEFEGKLKELFTYMTYGEWNGSKSITVINKWIEEHT